MQNSGQVVGDAVLSTDAAGRVAFLNRAAELLTDWPQHEAVGRAVTEVLRLVDEPRRAPVEVPELAGLQDSAQRELAVPLLLIARDGSERPIDLFATPLRDNQGSAVGAVVVFRDASERRRSEETRAQLAAIVESSEDAIIGKTLNGIIQSWNGGAERIFGYRTEEVVGQHISLLIPHERIDEETEILNRLRRGERVEHFETVRLRKDGERIDLSLTISPVRNTSGQIIGASKIGRDITRRKRAEAEQREQESRQRFLAELAAATQPLTSPDEVMLLTAKMLAEHLRVDRCAYAEIENESVFVVTGEYSRGAVASIVGRWPVAAFGPECTKAMRANEPYVVDDVKRDPCLKGEYLSAYRQTEIEAGICVPLHKEGRFVAAMAVHQKTPRSWLRAEVAMMQTVAERCWESLERTRVARGLRDAADRLALAFTAARLGDWSFDATTDEVQLSSRAAEIFAVDPSVRMTRMGLLQKVHSEDRERVRRAMEVAIEKRESYDVEYRIQRSESKICWASAKGRAQYRDDGIATGMFGVLQDITEKKQLEEELRQRADALAAADRNKDDFIALLAHELRNPLAPIRTGLQILRLAANDPTKMERAREMMDRQLSHMVRMIDDLLDVSRMSRKKLHLQSSEILLSEVIGHATEAAGPAIEAAGHILQVSIPEEPVKLSGDLTRLAQVVGNLLTNSSKYTTRGGLISLEAIVDNGAAVIRVRDNGIGIPSDALSGIFEMFSQLNRPSEQGSGGLGIGLFLVKGLVEAHGGRVVAESDGAGKGSVFSVYLPILSASTAANEETAPKDIAAALAGCAVLVADDNRDGAETMAELLTLMGHKVRVAHDGLEAVEVAEQLRPDLILMDLGMPRLDGLSAIRKIREHAWGRAISIIALTGWGQENDRNRSKEAGADGHLVKPVGLEDLEALMSSLKGGRGSDRAS